MYVVEILGSLLLEFTAMKSFGELRKAKGGGEIRREEAPSEWGVS